MNFRNASLLENGLLYMDRNRSENQIEQVDIFYEQVQ